MEVSTSHRTEVKLTPAEWFRADMRTGYGAMQVRHITAQWSSQRPAPALSLIGVEITRDQITEVSASQMLWAWTTGDEGVIAQIPPTVRMVMEAIGMVLPS